MWTVKTQSNMALKSEQSPHKIRTCWWTVQTEVVVYVVLDRIIIWSFHCWLVCTSNRPFQYCACVFYLCMVKVDSIHGKFLHIFQKVHLCFCWSHSSENTNTDFNCCCLGLLTMFNFHILWPIGFVQLHDLLLHFFGLIRSKTKFTDVICTTLICNTQRQTGSYRQRKTETDR